MDTHPRRPDDLNDLEQRLAAWQPSAAGLDADRMLFAAGRASVPAAKPRLVWPLVSACLVLVTGVLGAWLAVERAERLALAEQLRRQTTAPAPALAPEPAPAEPEATEPSPPDGYLALRRRWEHDPNSLLVMAAPVGRSTVPEPLTPNPPIPTAWQLDRVFDP